MRRRWVIESFLLGVWGLLALSCKEVQNSSGLLQDEGRMRHGNSKSYGSFSALAQVNSQYMQRSTPCLNAVALGCTCCLTEPRGALECSSLCATNWSGHSWLCPWTWPKFSTALFVLGYLEPARCQPSSWHNLGQLQGSNELYAVLKTSFSHLFLRIMKNGLNSGFFTPVTPPGHVS